MQEAWQFLGKDTAPGLRGASQAPYTGYILNQTLVFVKQSCYTIIMDNQLIYSPVIGSPPRTPPRRKIHTTRRLSGVGT